MGLLNKYEVSVRGTITVEASSYTSALAEARAVLEREEFHGEYGTEISLVAVSAEQVTDYA
jgi:hypothetical protein